MRYKYCLAFAVIGFILFYYLWFSPVLLLGVFVIVLMRIAYLVHISKNNKYDVEYKYGCSGIVFFGVLLLLTVFMHSKCYISAFGGKRHLYADCCNAADVHEVTKFGAFLWGCMDKCQYCVKRKHEEKFEKEKRLQEEMKKLEEQQKKENIAFLTRQIAELDSVRQLVLKGENIDVSEYEFRHDINFEQESEYDDGGFEPRGYR